MFTDGGYSYRTNNSFFDYEFESVGPKGVIIKIARFTSFGMDLYNFGFGDLDKKTGEINDVTISNNDDGEKILLTVARIIFTFTRIYFKSTVLIKGSTSSRTRRYQMGFNKYWDQIDPIFEVFGLKKDKWEHFRKGENYEAFLGRRKPVF